MKFKNYAVIPSFGDAEKKLTVVSHSTDRNLVELEINGSKIVVDGDSLKRAVDNCMNFARY